MEPGGRDEGTDGAEDGGGKCIHIQPTAPACDSKAMSHGGKVLLPFSGSRLSGDTELNILWHDPGHCPGWGAADD